MATLKKIYCFTVEDNCYINDLSSSEIQELSELYGTCGSCDDILIKLTILHRMFSSLSRRSCCGKLIDVCNHLIDRNVVAVLITLMNAADQHVVFMTTRALSSIFIYNPSLVKRFKLQDLFLDCLNYEWKAIHLMKMLTQVVNGLCRLESLAKECSKPCKCMRSSGSIIKHDAALYVGLMIQDSRTIILSYVPFWKDIFANYLHSNKDYTKYTNCDLDKFHKHHCETSLMIQQGLCERSIEMSGKTEQILLSFLQFLSAFFHWKVSEALFNGKIGTLEDEEENKRDSLMLSDGRELLTLIPLFAHILQIQGLSIEIWKNILGLLSSCMSSDTSGNQRFFIDLSHHVGAAILCSTTNGVLDNIPVYDGFECFGGECLTFQNRNILKPHEAHCGLIVRQMSLLTIKASLVMLNQENSDSLQLVLNVLNTWSSFLLYETNKTSCKMLLDVCADQDDDLLQMMLLLIKLHNKLKKSNNPAVLSTLKHFSPHMVFVEFLATIHFDHSVLLDFLVSSETVFLEYIMYYLQLVLCDWKGFCNIIQGHSCVEEKIPLKSMQLENDDNNKKTNNVSSLGGLSSISAAYGSDDSDSLHDDNDVDADDIVSDSVACCVGSNGAVGDVVSDHVFGDACCIVEVDDVVSVSIVGGCNGATDLNDGVSESVVGDDASIGNNVGDVVSDSVVASIDDSVLNDSKQFHYHDINSTLTSNTNEIPYQSTLERTMSTLIHLRISVQRLVKADLFPYNVNPLLRKLEYIENCFDGC